MFKKLTLAAAFGAGYVLGAKAGKERYQQIEAKFREIAGMPAVQSATSTVVETAGNVADTAKATVTDTVNSVADKVTKAADSGNAGASGTSTSGPTMAGAAPSGSAPDVTRP